MPNEKENKYIISSEQEAKEKAQAAMQAQALARAKRRLSKKQETTLTKEDNKNLISALPRKSSKSKIKLNSGHIISLLSIAFFIDLVQIGVATLDFLSSVTDITDYIANLALYIPVIGSVIFGIYQSVKLSTLTVIWIIKATLALTLFLLGKMLNSIIWWLAGVDLLVRIGVRLEPEMKARAIFMWPVRIFLGIFEVFIPIFPGFTVLTLLQIQRVKKYKQILERKGKFN